MSTASGVHTTILTRGECLDLLGQATVGRVGVSIDALPAIMPVRFALSGESVVFTTRSGSKLDAAVNGSVVAFEADASTPGHAGWSVLWQGIASRVTDPDDLARIRSVPMLHWPGDPAGERWTQIRDGTLSGRIFR